MKNLVLNYIGEDHWGVPTYKDEGTGRLIKDIGARECPDYRLVEGNDIDDDQGWPLESFSVFRGRPIVIKGKEDAPTREEKFNYMLLSRLVMDCDYFLGYGNGHVPHLWANSVEGQIAKMRELYGWFADDKKPEWLTPEQIDAYEKKMLEKTTP